MLLNLHLKGKQTHHLNVVQPDEALAVEAKSDSKAFALLYRRHVPSVYRYHHIARVGNVDDAQDLTAQTFLAAQENIASFQGRGKFTAWLM